MILLKPILLRTTALAALWWTLTGGRADAWSMGVPLVLIAVAVSLRLAAPGPYRLNPVALAAFAGYFLWQSLWASVDVARRALQPRLALDPGLVEQRLRLPVGLPRVLLANTLSLLPGSLVVHLDDNGLVVHVLDRQNDLDAEVRAAESRIARVFGLTEGDSGWS